MPPWLTVPTVCNYIVLNIDPNFNLPSRTISRFDRDISCVISSLDYKEMISNIKTADLVYMDPPYQGVCRDKDNRYYSSIDHCEFVNFLSELNTKKVPYLISYDGKCGNKKYGNHLPDNLRLKRIELEAGRSSQATLLGKKDITFESLYLSESLLELIDIKPENYKKQHHKQLMLLEEKSAYA